MGARQSRGGFESTVPFAGDGVETLAVYCADGRYGDQADDLLHYGLKLPRYDRLVVPGGPADLVHYANAFFEEQAAVGHLELLLRAHPIRHVVLIAHEDCGYYLHRLQVKAAEMEERQRADLDAAIERVRSLAPGVTVSAFYARRAGDKVRFEELRIAGAV